MLLIDLDEGRIIDDAEIKQKLAAEHPYEAWLEATQFKLAELPELSEEHSEPAHRPAAAANDPAAQLNLQQAFGYTQEDIQFFLEPMARNADDPVGSMGTDTPIAALSTKPKLLYNYFKQNFAQVTNPPIDPIREELVMSLVSMIGPRPNLLGHEAGTHYRLEVAQPILTDGDLQKTHAIESLVPAFRTDTLDATWPAAEGADGLAPALERLCREATLAVEAGHNILILSDRATSAGRVPIPALLATSAVHHHLIRRGQRTLTGIVVETGEAREVHHFCALAGYGAEAINPYLAFATIEQIRVENGLPLSAAEVQKNYLKAVGKGILKVMSKMGISTYQSYCGAQIFDAIGLGSDFVDKYFTGTATTIEGVGLAEIAREAVERHRHAYGDNPIYHEMLDVGGDYAFRLRGEDHAWTPQSVARLQHAVRGEAPGRIPGVCRDDQRSERAPPDDTRADVARFRARAGAARRGRAGGRDRQAVCHRGDELRLDQPRGAHDARDRDEPDRRQVQYRRGRRGGDPVQAARQRRFDALGDQAGGLGPVRRHHRIPRQCRCPADQDGAGGETRRGRPTARAQGRQDDRPGAPFDPGGRADLAAAAPRHLFDRGSGPADPRSEKRQSRGGGVGQARFRGRGRHRRRRGRQGARRPCDDRRVRGWHRGEPADLA